MNNVSTISPRLKSLHCPAPLRELPGWLVWREEVNPKRPDKPRKVPYYAAGGRRHHAQGSVEDRARLVTFDAALQAAVRTGASGVGLALMPEFGVVALDFDRCVTPDGQVLDAVERLVAGTYAEVSPSGTGVRAFMHGALGNHKSAGGEDAAWGFETFSDKGFVTFTGNALEGTYMLACEDTVAPLSPEVRALADARFGRGPSPAPERDDPLMAYAPVLGLTRGQLDECLSVLDADLPHDRWLQVGMALHHETDGEGFELWDAWSSRGSKYDGAEALAARWQSFGREAGRPVTARLLLKLAGEAGVRITDTASADDVAEAAERPAVDATKPLRFEVVQAAAFSAGPEPTWLVKDLLPQAELAVLYGEPGSGKSFAMLDLAMAVARGEPWRGLRVRQGPVVYVAAEGGGGFRRRLRAYAQHHGIDLASVPFYVVHVAPNMLQKVDAVDLIRAIRQAVPGGRCALAVLDTLAQVTPGGNENSGEDMGRALAHCKAIHLALGALVVLVHHSGKDASKGARGWSGLRGAADVELEVRRIGDARALKVTKQKDGDDRGEWGFDLEVVTVGLDEDGEAITSCVTVAAEVPVVQVAGGRAKPLGKWEALLVEVVGEFALAQSRMAVADVMAEALRRAPAAEEGKRDRRAFQLRRALAALSEGDEAPYWVDGDYLEVM